jgi:Spy/CpxP family protein refolding chaperone
MNVIQLAAALIATASSLVVAAPLESVDSSAMTPAQCLALLDAQIGTNKLAVLKRALQLSAEQEAAFWPVYREYDKALAQLHERRNDLMHAFAATYGQSTDADATALARSHFKLRRDRLRLRERYFREVAAATSPTIAARFLQVENTFGALGDMRVGANVPIFE